MKKSEAGFLEVRIRRRIDRSEGIYLALSHMFMQVKEGQGVEGQSAKPELVA